MDIKTCTHLTDKEKLAVVLNHSCKRGCLDADCQYWRFSSWSTIIANELVNVQPMPPPTGALFRGLKFVYNKEKEE